MVDKFRKQMSKIVAYTDGSAKPNPGIGGWGWVLTKKYDDLSKTSLKITDWGGSDFASNNKMEATAMAELLEFCQVGSNIDIYTDSKYVLNDIIGGMPTELVTVKPVPQGRISRLRKTHVIKEYSNSYWKLPESKLPNSYEIYKIDQALIKHSVGGSVLKFCWVKGHSGNIGNDTADKLSNMYSQLRNT